MFTNTLPKRFWGEAILTASFLINRMPSQILSFKTLIQVFTQAYPHSRLVSNIPLKVFGCVAFVHIHSQNRNKFDPRAVKTMFLGYSPTQKGYKCYDPLTKRTYVSYDVTFFEDQSYYSKNSLQGEHIDEDHFWKITSSSVQLIQLLEPVGSINPFHPPMPLTYVVPEREEVNQKTGPELRVYSRRQHLKSTVQPPNYSTDLNPNLNPDSIPSSTEATNPPQSSPKKELPIAQRKGVRSCTLHPIDRFVSYHALSQPYKVFLSNLSSVTAPKNINEAMKDPAWRDAILEEMKALEKNKTWEVTSLPNGVVPVGCKWVFTIKHKADGTVDRFKARLVAKGYTQTYDIDYQETFAPMAKMNTVRVLLSLAAIKDWSLHQMDVKNVFLNGELEEEVYMQLPPGFEEPQGKNKVCRLLKSLYGLKQSPRAWFDRFSKTIRGAGYSQGLADHTMFYRHSDEGGVIILIVYVDDIIITSNDDAEIRRLKVVLAADFEIKDLGKLKYFLGMEVARSKEGIVVSQRKYTLDLLKEVGMLGGKSAAVPIDPNHKIGMFEGVTDVDRESYQRLVGKLIYLSHTRPDISFSVSVVSQFMHAPKEEHLEAVYRILKYLKNSPGQGLLFKKGGELTVEAYTDADWAGSVTDRRSTSGWCTLVGGNLVTWRSKKQSVVARSSAEAEYRAVAQGMCELLWLRRLLDELKVIPVTPMKLYCDSKAAISIANNPVQHDRTKHIEIDRHFIKEKLEEGIICTPYVPTKEQLADVFTKGLTKTTFESLTDKLGLCNIYKPA